MLSAREDGLAYEINLERIKNKREGSVFLDTLAATYSQFSFFKSLPHLLKISLFIDKEKMEVLGNLFYWLRSPWNSLVFKRSKPWWK